MILCKDCLHHAVVRVQETSVLRQHDRDECGVLVGTPHPIDGQLIEDGVECGAMRLGWCGEDAKKFEPKEEE